MREPVTVAHVGALAEAGLDRLEHEAGEKLSGVTPTVYADSGTENVDGLVDQLHNYGVIRRVLAQVEVAYSNSTIEAFWRSTKHQWL